MPSRRRRSFQYPSAVYRPARSAASAAGTRSADGSALPLPRALAGRSDVTSVDLSTLPKPCIISILISMSSLARPALADHADLLSFAADFESWLATRPAALVGA